MSNYQNKNAAKYAEIFKALSNPNRLRIFMRLVSCCPPGNLTDIKGSMTETEGCGCVGELGQDLGIVPSTIPPHIKQLYRAGLIKMERRGQKSNAGSIRKQKRPCRIFFLETELNWRW